MFNFHKRKDVDTAVTRGRQALKALGIKYKSRADGTLLVQGNITIDGRQLTELPDLSAVVVTGDFHCHYTSITSLKGAPREVGGDFWCFNCKLTSLDGAPQTDAFTTDTYQDPPPPEFSFSNPPDKVPVAVDPESAIVAAKAVPQLPVPSTAARVLIA